MSTETNQEVVVAPEANESEKPTVEEIKLSKAEYDELIGTKATVGSLKRQLKDLQKAKEEKPETPTTETKPDEISKLQQKLEKQALKAAGITSEDEVELAQKTAKKWGMDIDDVLDDEDFKAKLEKLRTQKSNEAASSNIKGSGGTGSAKNSVEYWKAKGTPPTPDQVPDRATRQKIVRAMLPSGSTGSKFYNDK